MPAGLVGPAERLLAMASLRVMIIAADLGLCEETFAVGNQNRTARPTADPSNPNVEENDTILRKRRRQISENLRGFQVSNFRADK